MLSINTNLSSSLVNQSLNKITIELNKTLERLSTGFKINHASDNAANYSIAASYSYKLSSYNIASDNIECGLDMLTTVQDTISIMEGLGTRLHALATQARNGTYGEASLAAINSEAAAIIAEIDRLYNSAEYNGIKLFTKPGGVPVLPLPEWVDNLNNKLDPAKYDGFISDPKTESDSYVSTLQHVSEVSSFTKNTAYQISTKEDIERLAELVNDGKDTSKVTFYLGADIDLNGENWTPIANRSKNSSYQFKGTFDGNGHVIKNFTVNNTGKNYAGLFGYANSSASIKNLGVENAKVVGSNYSALLVGSSDGSITNCYATGDVEGKERVGAIAGNITKDVTNTYSNATVKGKKYAGGIAGYATKVIRDCFSEGTVTTTSDYAAGIAGCTDGKIENCYSKANMKGNNIVGGLAGRTAEAITNSYATGDAEGYEFVGGIAGIIKKTSGTLSIDNILSLGHITAVQKSGSLLGGIENTAATKSPYNFSTVNITNGYVIEQELPKIGGAYTTASGNAPVPYDITEWLNNITYLEEVIEYVPNDLSFQVGIYGNNDSKISINTDFEYDLSYLLENGMQGEGAYDVINNFLQALNAKATMYSANSNRLESALESVHSDIMNITSSLSTIKDVDIAKVSSKYIQQQILQQAAATLLVTANQTPSIALQLI